MPVQDLAQRLARDVLHGNEAALLFALSALAYLMDHAHVGMRERRGRPCLLLEALQPVRILAQAARQELERDPPPQPRVLGQVDLPMPPEPSNPSTR